MILISLLSCALTALLQPHPAFAQQSTSSSQQGREENPIAILFEIKGDVRTKSAAALNWVEGRAQLPLFAGDLVFSGNNGKARLEYIGIGATVLIGPNSLTTVRRMPPSLSKFRRSFGADRGRRGGQSQSKTGERTMTLAGSQDVGKNTPAQPVFDVGLTLSRDVDVIPMLYPLGRVFLHARRYPSRIPVRLDKTWDGVGLWAFLWRLDDDLVPVWSGFSRGSFAGIPIPKAGTYKLQIVSEDEVRTTAPITIKATQGAALALKDWPSGSAEEPSTVVFQ